MISQQDMNQFMVYVRQDNTGRTGWTRTRSSLRFTLGAIEAYNRRPSLVNFNAIITARQNIPGAKQTQYQTALTYLDNVLALERDVASQQELLGRLADNKFRVSSGLEEYRKAFGEPFATAVTKMDDNDRWLDGGSGEAKAMIEYLADGGRARCTATGFAVPTQAMRSVQQAENTYKNRFEYISGKYFGDIDNSELDWPGGGSFDLITDLNGVLYYTPSLVEDLSRYLELLKVGGVLLFTSVEAKIDAPNADHDERRIPGLAKWASNIGGVSVELHARSWTLFYAISKTSNDIVIPHMTCEKYETGQRNAPTRLYSCNQHLPNNPTVV